MFLPAYSHGPVRSVQDADATVPCRRPFDAPAGLVAGEYRITFSALESKDGDFIGQLHTNPFQIE